MANLEAARESFHAALLDDDVEKLYEQAPCGYLSTTPEGVIVKVNQTFLTWTGFTRAELVGRRRFPELLTAGGRIYHETHFAPMLHMQRDVREIALDLVRADGATLPTLVNAGLERDALGGPLVIRIAVFDASQRREYERELLRAKERAERSETRAVALAQTLQQTLIPPSPPDIPGLAIAAVYRPAGDGNEVGGDFYDVFQVGEDDWVVVLGDVSGKGAEAAVVTSLIRYSLRAIAVRVPDPSVALRELNEVVLAHATERFCTLAMARLTRTEEGWRIATTSAGHPPALLWRAGGEPEAMGEPGFLIGVVEEATFTTAEIALGSGDAVVLYTDGVPEGRSGEEFFGEDRLHASLKAHGPDPTLLTRGLLGDVLAFQGDLPRDDIAILAVRAP